MMPRHVFTVLLLATMAGLLAVAAACSDEEEGTQTATPRATADANGRFTFDEEAVGPFVTATATDAGGNTSPFSEARAVTAR